MAACADEAAPAAPASGACRSGRPDKADIPIATQASPDATTFYVRTDGGDAAQCTGRADAAYPGSGTGQACAWKHPGIALPSSGPTRMAGGDTLVIGAGTYQVGNGGDMQSIPSGPGASRPTRFVGKPGARPKLVGVDGAHRVLNLDGSSNVEVGNLEITDGSDCVYKHSNAAAACTDSMPWARVGLYARASSNVWLHDLDIHGMAARGINAGGLSNWTMERIKLNRNGTAGWDGNVGDNGSNSGRIILRDIEIAWNGCGERVATGEPWACWAQRTGGYGDGLGTTDTGGQWLIEDAFVHHNTSDGLDLRYMDGADATRVTLRRIHAVANAGNQVKVKGNSLIENSVLVGNCSYFKNKFFMTERDLCRADGSTLQLVMTGNDTATVRHNTIAGEGAVQIGHSEGTAGDRIDIRNNLVVGFPYYEHPDKLSGFNGGDAQASKRFVGNMGWNVRACPADTVCDQDPKLTNMTLAAFDAKPEANSPANGKAGAVSCKRSPAPGR
ncbi:hypothetical protein ACFPOA_08450 [Lysobacter niabensis]|uniref:hypothetical protein n=1 Tax=Agrilutibacter niabensis TaxID=380628 RepID=UPI0036101B39